MAIPIEQAVIFDVDSTLVTIEGLDYLAATKNLGPQIEAITNQGMNGQLDFNQSLMKRLTMLKPTHRQLVGLGRAYCHHLTPGVADTLKQLSAQYDIWLVSGGVQPSVDILAEHLGINKVAANQLNFTPSGRFHSLNTKNPLSHAGGKAKIVLELRPRYHHITFVGDGVTDLETLPLVNTFIGFGGVIYREKVAQGSPIYVRQKNLTAILNHING